MSKYQIPLRLDPDIAEATRAVARAEGVSINTFVTKALVAEIDRVRQDPEFTKRARQLLTRDAEIIRQLAGQ